MKILVISGSFPKTSETFIYQAVKNMLAEGLDVNVVTNAHSLSKIEDKMYTRELSSRTIRVQSSYLELIKNPLIISTVFTNGKILNALKQALTSPNPRLEFSLLIKSLIIYNRVKPLPKFDAIHAYFGPNGSIASYLKILGISDKVLVSFLGYDVSRLTTQVKPINYQPLFQNADRMLPISDYFRSKLISLGANDSKIAVHHIGVNLSDLCFNDRTIPNGSLRIISVARLTEKKGILYAIEAIQFIVKKRPEIRVRYDIIGDGELIPSLKTIVSAYNLDNNITFHGSKSHSESLSLMAEADLMLAPSVTAEDGDQEGIPVVIMEAMAMGLPVVSTQHAGIPELISDKVDGFLVPERNSDALANAILSLADITDMQLKKMLVAAREKIENAFDSKMLFKYYVEAILQPPSQLH